MGFPGNNSWQYYDADSYWQAREAAGIPQPASTTQAPHVPPAAGADDLAGQFADLRLGRPERHRASDAGATLAPRGAAPGIGGSMRLPPSAAAALVGRDSFHSARMPYVPESPPDSPEPYAAPQPTRHSSAYASYTTRHEAAPRRKGGFMSGFTKSLKKAFGFGSSRRKDSYSRNAGASSSHHSTDASLRPPPVSRVSSGRTSGTLHRMDSAPQSPERVQVRLSDADRETNLDPAEFRSQSIPTSPGTRSDCELLAHSFGREHGAELAYAPWAGPMGMPPAPHWQPLAPSPWESAFAHWDAADAAQMAHHDAGMSSHAMGAGPFQAGPSSSTLPPQQLWAPPAFGLQPVGPAMSSMNLGRGIEAMELMHQDLFTSPSIASVAGRRAVVPPVMSTRDVDMDECLVVNTAAGEYDSIGTLGVATCFAMCARGVNDEGQTILGLLHHSGVDPQGGRIPPRAALQRLRDEMQEAGARGVSIHVVGGMSSPDPDYDTLDDEWELLGLRNEFNIRGARLHVNSIEEAGEESYVDVLMTKNRVYFSRNQLYEHD